jgi:glycosyltransferase involved in cell wall biosynthesis
MVAHEWWAASHGGFIHRRYFERLRKLADNPRVAFLAVSQAIRNRAIDVGLPAEKISVHGIGIDTSFFRPDESSLLTKRSRRVLFVGRLVEKKGVAYLIRAFEHVRRLVDDAELTIVGDGPLRTSLEAMARSRNLPIEFLGNISPSDVRRELARCRVLCLPSVTAANGDAEGFGLVLLEAQASGIPVVTSARGGAEEGIEDARSGFRIEERDEATMIEKLRMLLIDDELATRMSKAAVLFARNRFDLAKCTLELETIYDRHIGCGE